MSSVLSFFLKYSLKQQWIQINHTLWGVPLNNLLNVWEAFGMSCWMPWSGQVMGEEFSSHCQVLNSRSVYHTLQKAELQWQSTMDLSKYLSNREQWYETILQDSVACKECCWPWSHLLKRGNTLGCLPPLHHSNMNWKKRNPRPLKKPIFSEELLVDGSWWRKDFDFCSFNSHLSSMCVQKGGMSWRKGNIC